MQKIYITDKGKEALLAMPVDFFYESPEVRTVTL